jgi:integrative and conjugative element protein (TIGR02256 family)
MSGVRGCIDLNTASPLVMIDNGVLESTAAIARACQFRHEVGGVLLGCYRAGALHITDATAPQKGDRWSPTRFWRSPTGHQSYAETAWRNSKGVITHVGEWHSHAETCPKPSSIDRKSWSEALAEQRRAMTFLIVGTRSVHLSVGAGLGVVRELVEIERDDRSTLFATRLHRLTASDT